VIRVVLEELKHVLDLVRDRVTDAFLGAAQRDRLAGRVTKKEPHSGTRLSRLLAETGQELGLVLGKK
jgi:hypothetical protein